MTIISTAAVIGQISSKIKITISKQKPEEELDIKFELFSMLICQVLLKNGGGLQGAVI